MHTTSQKIDPFQMRFIPAWLNIIYHVRLGIAEWQVGRIAKQRGISVDTVKKAIRDNTQAPLFGVLGEPVVNVLAVNVALDKLAKSQ